MYIATQGVAGGRRAREHDYRAGSPRNRPSLLLFVRVDRRPPPPAI